MGRVAVIEYLGGYPALNALGISKDEIWPNFARDGSSRKDGVWLILRWGPNIDRFGSPGGKRMLNIWAYQTRQIGTDFITVDMALSVVTEAMLAAVQYVGSDGSVLRCADFNGFSGDLIDEGYDAIARSADFTVLCSEA